MFVCLSLCLFVPLNFSGVSTPIRKCEVLLEVAQQVFWGFKQNPNQNWTLKTLKLEKMIKNP